MLAAGIQVPIAAGVMAACLARRPPGGHVDPTNAVWETLRLTPPTWITARITTREVELDGHRVPAGPWCWSARCSSGRLDEVVPGDPA